MTDNKKSEVITFRTDELTKAKLQKIANKRRWKVSQIIDIIINDNINAYELAAKEMLTQDRENTIPVPVHLTKENDETVYQVSEHFNIPYDTAINLIIAHIRLEWPFYDN